MELEVVVIAGADQGRTFPLTEGQPLTLGRATSKRDGLNDMKASREHCELALVDGKVQLRDLDSRNGTYFRREAVNEAELRPGDCFQIGDTGLEVRRVGGNDDEATVSQDESPTFGSDSPSLDQLIGRKVGQFEILEKVVEGSTGVVFRATDESTGINVALRVLYPQFVAGDGIKRVERAVRTMKPIRHENLIAMYGAGNTDGYGWIAMEFFEGENLTQMIKRLGVGGTLDWRYAVRAGVQIARALETLHEHKVVHRALTPKHILGNREGKLFKLGGVLVAKALEGSLADSVTMAGELVGEVPYMSPEQTYGTQDLDVRADIYGLGATMFAMLCGHAPFDGRSEVEIVRKIRNNDPGSPWKGQMGISDHLTDAVTRMLAKNREERFDTPEELRVALERAAMFCEVAV